MIIDSHSHIGKDFYFGESKLEDYDKFCTENKIDIGLLMPMPWPVYIDNDLTTCSLIWEHENYKKINYYKITKQKDIFNKEPIYSNPYKEINYYYYNLIKNMSLKTDIKFIPMIHGYLDNEQYLIELIENTKPVAVKFHGFSSGFFNTDVKPEVIKILKKYELPIIIHTSVYKYDDGYGANTKIWRNKCSPSNWLEFLLSNELSGVLNHGACLDEKTINLVNKSNNIMIGIGPDLDISYDYRKVLIEKTTYIKTGYLNILKSIADPNKLLFDIDYNWNKKSDGYLDNDSVNRIKNTWNSLDSEKILYKNAKKIYKI